MNKETERTITRELKKENRKILNEPIPATMGPRFHFYRGVVFLLVIQVLTFLFFTLELK